MHAHRIALDLPLSSDAPALARRALDGFWLERSARENVTLVTSELVSNSVRHSGAGAGTAIRLRVVRDAGVVRISVTDDGAGFALAGTSREPGVSGGFGLFLVDRLADAWGIDRTTVWCELREALPGPAAPHPASQPRHGKEHGERHDDEHAESVER